MYSVCISLLKVVGYYDLSVLSMKMSVGSQLYPNMEYIVHGSKNQIDSSIFHLLWSESQTTTNA